MRILFLIDSFNCGGIQKSLLRLAEGCRDGGDEIAFAVLRNKGVLCEEAAGLAEVFELRETGNFRPPLQRVGRRTHAFLDYAKVYGVGWFNFGLKTVLRYGVAYEVVLESYRPDIVVSTNSLCNVLAVCGRSATAAEHKIVAWEHVNISGLYKSKIQSALKARRVFSCLRQVLHGADRVVAVSRGVKEDLMLNLDLGADKVEVIYNGVPKPEEASPEDASVAGAPCRDWLEDDSVPLGVSVGRISEGKDYETLIEAAKIVMAARPFRLMIIGGADKARHREIRRRLEAKCAALGIAQNVRFLGYQQDPLAFVKRSNVFVLSSLYEGFGLVLVEALACGCPIVSSDCPSGPAEILENGRYGRLVPMKNPAALAKAILSTLDAPLEPEKLQERSGAFALDRNIARYRQLLGEVLAA